MACCRTSLTTEDTEDTEEGSLFLRGRPPCPPRPLWCCQGLRVKASGSRAHGLPPLAERLQPGRVLVQGPGQLQRCSRREIGIIARGFAGAKRGSECRIRLMPALTDRALQLIDRGVSRRAEPARQPVSKTLIGDSHGHRGGAGAFVERAERCHEFQG